MFGVFEWPLNASRGLSAIAEFLVRLSEATAKSTSSLNSFKHKSKSLSAVYVPAAKKINTIYVNVIELASSRVNSQFRSNK